ncbi:MucR family transcriptional regulator [Brevibacterium litoralis]|uniref:MucR family transcriptional regulator n=1 Tax=Brevibacterium litoralis TaxID=3138935 RepID=UPI0032EAD593
MTRRRAPLRHPDEESTPSLECLECGRHYRHLTSHLRIAHDVGPAEYRAEHGLPEDTPLVSDEIRAHISERMRSQEHLEKLALARERYRRPPRPPRSTDDRAIADLPEWTDIAACTQAARELLDSGQQTKASLARVYGVSPAAVNHRLRRYPSAGEYEHCVVDGCTSPAYTRGYCTAHYQQVNRAEKAARRSRAA